MFTTLLFFFEKLVNYRDVKCDDVITCLWHYGRFPLISSILYYPDVPGLASVFNSVYRVILGGRIDTGGVISRNFYGIIGGKCSRKPTI